MVSATISENLTEPLLDNAGHIIPTLTKRPYKDYRIDSCVLGISETGTPCLRLPEDLTGEEIIDCPAFASAIYANTAWTLIGETIDRLTTLNISLKSLTSHYSNTIIIEHAQPNLDKNLQLAKHYSFILAGVYSLTPEESVARGIYIASAKIKAWQYTESTKASGKHSEDLRIALEVSSHDYIHYLAFAEPVDPFNILTPK